MEGLKEEQAITHARLPRNTLIILAITTHLSRLEGIALSGLLSVLQLCRYKHVDYSYNSDDNN